MADEVTIVVRAEDNFSNVLGNFGNILTGIKSTIDMVADAFRVGAEFVGQFVNSASESELAVAKLDAILRATGGAAGLTSDQLQDMANQLQLVTRYSDETILGGVSLMLTFRNIGDEMMTRAIPLMLDMAEVFGSVDSSAMQLGKALNDPVNMLGALSRAGVTFSDEQKETIKTMVEMGDLAGAQTLILNELEMQVGSTAEAIGQTFAGQIDIAKNKLDTMKETIGNALLPILGDLLSRFMEFADTNPVIQGVLDFFERFTELQNSEGDFPILSSLGAAMLGLENISPILHDIGYALLVFQGAMTNGATPMEAFNRALADLATVWAGSPLGDIVTRIQEFIDTGQSEGWGTAIRELFDDIIDAIDFPTRIQNLVDSFSNIITVTDWTDVTSTLADVLTDIITLAITTTLAGLDVIINQVDWTPIGVAFKGALGEVWAGMFEEGDDGASIWEYVKLGFIMAIHNNPILDVGFNLGISLAEMYQKGFDTGKEVVNGLIDGWNKLFTNSPFLQKIQSMIDSVKDFLGIASPSTVFFDIGKNIVLGLINGIDSMIDNFRDIIRDLLAPLQPLLDLLGIDLGTGSTTRSHDTGLGGTTGGHSGTGGTGITGTGTGQTVNNYFYGPVYFNQSAESTNYDCPSPHPLLVASQGSLLTSGL